MITREQIPSVLDHAVMDSGGNKIGDAKHVFLDDASGRPEWASVKTGMFGNRESFIPIREASLVEDHLEVPYDKAKVKDAPEVDVDSGGHLSAEEEQRLYEYYGVDWDAGWQNADEPGEAGAAGTAGTIGAAGAAGTAADRPGAATGMTGGTERTPDMAAGTANMDTTAGSMEMPGEAAAADAYMIRSEERMHIGTERREAGRARLHKYVVTEQTDEPVQLRHEEVRVVREPIADGERSAASGAGIAESDREVTLHADRPVVETETVPVERVRLAVEERMEQEMVHGEIRKERIDVDMPDDTERGGRETGGRR